jgi:ribosomal protein S18 acetylase RimI-like enzyme
MLKVQYSLLELKKTKYYSQMVVLEELLFTNSLEKIYKFDNTLKFSLIINKFDNVVAFLVYKDHGIAYDIFKIGVEQNLRSQGLATLLLVDLFDKDIVLEVRVNNYDAISFYKKHNFREYEKMIGYYNGIDGIKMIRSMNEC